MHDYYGSFYFIVLCFTPIAIFVFGIFLLVNGLRGVFKREKPGRAIFKTLFGLLIVAPYLSVAGCVVYQMNQSKILAQGMSPHGLEYCVVQSYNSLTEPFQVSFFIRDPGGVWHWHYLAHQDSDWKSARVEFDGDTARVYRRDELRGEIKIPTLPADPATVDKNRGQHFPASMTVEELFRWHKDKF